jgi:hypothetical protein
MEEKNNLASRVVNSRNERVAATLTTTVHHSLMYVLRPDVFLELRIIHHND